MKLDYLPSEFQEALPILEKIKAAGFEAYFVGGSVRDAILERPIHDVDIATSSYPQETKEIFRRTIDFGIEHGTVLVLEGEGEYEVTTFRTEDVYVDYRRPSQVSFVRSLEEDLKRRDFTVNAFALDENAQVIDKFDGLTDLNNRLLRAVGLPAERFGEDALRIMRGFRFAATLDFTIEDMTFEAMKKMAPLLEKISIERIFIEFDKLLMADFWAKGIAALVQSQAFQYLPMLENRQVGLLGMLEILPHDTRFTSSEQAWAMLMIALEIGDTKTFCRKWKTSNDFQKTVNNLVKIWYARLQGPPNKELCYAYGKENLLLVEKLRQMLRLDVDMERIAELDAALVIHSKYDMAVNGGTLIAELSMKPGPHLGQILDEVEMALVHDHLPNEKEAILAFIKEREIKG
ncbi:CCA tRNA nucleotidyltransferase [Streptococcus sp. X16XC17]|uniref:CCA tRNA nucleotidyltransferase n=1 Tax=unclassified Streptococcus TaxID=2608887 RepID=UPI00066FBE67|nr:MULTISPECIES: CCA tRNA nucleotidyltransferase [unclassified Streptococcus]TCD46316.1 CCA tRNA nucleotidyltransferase [Streptococcus sp. X16XC17]